MYTGKTISVYKHRTTGRVRVEEIRSLHWAEYEYIARPIRTHILRSLVRIYEVATKDIALNRRLLIKRLARKLDQINGLTHPDSGSSTHSSPD